YDKTEVLSVQDGCDFEFLRQFALGTRQQRSLDVELSIRKSDIPEVYVATPPEGPTVVKAGLTALVGPRIAKVSVFAANDNVRDYLPKSGVNFGSRAGEKE